MRMLNFARNGNYKRFYENLKEVSKTNGRKPWIMFIDCAFSVLITGSGLSDYLNFKFYEKSWKERKSYVTIGYQAKFYKKAAHDEKHICDHKVEFLKQFKEFTKRDFFDPNDSIENLKKFVDKHPTFVMKPIDGLGGDGVKKDKLSNYKNVEELYNTMKKNNTFIEEIIIQNKEWGKISPNSINTLRVMTSNVNGNVKIFCIMARIGNGINFADNFHQGGVGVYVDTEKGVLKGNAINKDLEEFEYHQTTNIKFDNYKIPFFDKVSDLCIEAAKKIPEVNIIGWDVAITDNGPLIIEGNNGPGFDLIQVVLKKGTKYMLEDIEKEMKKANIW